jgi:hypothetical protein
MALNAQSSAGTTISISATLPASYDATGFGNVATVYTPIGEVTNIGEFGKVYTLITHNPLATRKTEKLKGSYNNGSATLALAIYKADAGQILASTASDSDAAYAVKVVYQDGSIDYFTALVMSFTTNPAGVDDILSGSINIELDNDIVPVAAP